MPALIEPVPQLADDDDQPGPDVGRGLHVCVPPFPDTGAKRDRNRSRPFGVGSGPVTPGSTVVPGRHQRREGPAAASSGITRALPTEASRRISPKKPGPPPPQPHPPPPPRPQPRRDRRGRIATPRARLPGRGAADGRAAADGPPRRRLTSPGGRRTTPSHSQV